MTRKYRIKDIAKLAGVSAGTVDRVIHNRGDVSEASRKKVEETLASIDYRPSLHLSSIGVKKQYAILIVIPQFSKGEYWEQIEQGIRQALYEFSHIKIRVKFFYYDHFDLYSCHRAFAEALREKCDGVVIGPTFHDETMYFTNTLSNRGIPYVFVDTSVDNTDPIAFFGPNPYASGHIASRMLSMVMEPGKDVAVFQAKRIGNESSTQNFSRKYGFLSYLKEHSPDTKVSYGYYFNRDTKESWKIIGEFFSGHPEVGGAVVFNSRAYILAGYLKKHNIRNIKLVGCSAIARNVDYLKGDYISCLIGERPAYQGYMSIKATLEYLLYNKRGEVYNYTPMDIIIKENIDFYTDAYLVPPAGRADGK